MYRWLFVNWYGWSHHLHLVHYLAGVSIGR